MIINSNKLFAEVKIKRNITEEGVIIIELRNIPETIDSIPELISNAKKEVSERRMELLEANGLQPTSLYAGVEVLRVYPDQGDGTPDTSYPLE